MLQLQNRSVVQNRGSKMMANFKTCLILLGMFGLVKLDPVVFNDCGSIYELDEVDIEGCNDRATCILYNGTTPEIRMKVTANTISRHFNQTVKLVLRGVQVNIDSSPKDICTSIICPVAIQEKKTFIFKIHLNKNNLVPLPGYLRWESRNDQNKLVLCTEVDIKVRS